MFRVWTETSCDGEVWKGVSTRSYVRKGNAERAAKRMTADYEHAGITAHCTVSETNPWEDDE